MMIIRIIAMIECSMSMFDERRTCSSMGMLDDQSIVIVLHDRSNMIMLHDRSSMFIKLITCFIML